MSQKNYSYKSDANTGNKSVYREDTRCDMERHIENVENNIVGDVAGFGNK